MASQLAVISARARRLHKLLAQADDITTSTQVGKLMEEAAEVAQADLAADTDGLIHELADVIIVAAQCALAADTDGLDLLWDELADTLAADCRRTWRSYGGVIRHSAPWTGAELEEAASAASTTIEPDPARPGTARVTIHAIIPGSLPPKLAGMRPDVMHDFAADLLAHTRLAPPVGRHLAISDVTVEDGVLTVHGTLTSTEGAPRPEETSW